MSLKNKLFGGNNKTLSSMSDRELEKKLHNQSSGKSGDDIATRVHTIQEAQKRGIDPHGKK